MSNWLVVLLLIAVAQATPWFPGNALQGSYHQLQAPPPPLAAPPTAPATGLASMCSSTLQQPPRPAPWLQAVPSYPPTAPASGMFNVIPTPGPPARGTRMAAEPGVAYMLGIYMQPMRLPAHVPVHGHAGRGALPMEIPKAVEPVHDVLAVEARRDRELGEEGLSLLDDTLLQQLGDILTQYEEGDGDDDDEDPQPALVSVSAPAQDRRSAPPAPPPGPPRRSRLVVEDVRPAWPSVHLGELVLTEEAAFAPPSAPASASAAVPAALPLPLPHAALAPPASVSRPQRTSLSPSVPYSRSRRFLA